MDYILSTVNENQERLKFEGPLEEAHRSVRDLWTPSLASTIDGADASANSRLSWKKGSKCVIYRWNGEDVLLLAPEVVFQEYSV